MLTIHIRINDEQGQATPVWLKISDDSGRMFVPFGYTPNGDKPIAIPGTCEVALPSDVPLQIVAQHGPEAFKTLTTRVTLKPGQLTLRFQFTGPLNDTLGWIYGGLCRGGSPHQVALEGAADGNQIVQLLACQSEQGSTNFAAFSGEEPTLSKFGCDVVVNTCNSHQVLGTVGLLNCHRPILPMSDHDPSYTDDWLLTDWCDQCHRKNGLTVWLDPSIEDCSLVLVAALLGKIDAIGWKPSSSADHLQLWYDLLGLCLPISIITDNSLSVAGPRSRTVITSEPNVPKTSLNWIEGVRQRNGFVSVEPLIRDGGNAESSSEFAALQRIVDGKIVQSTLAREDGFWEADIYGEPPHNPLWRWSALRVLDQAGCVLAHTMPYCHEQGRRIPVEGSAMIDCINLTKQWAIEQGRFTNPKRRDEMLQLCDDALQVVTSTLPR